MRDEERREKIYRYKAIVINGKKYNEHRYIMEQYLGRKLRRDEVVHHKNGAPRDNRIENLEVMNLSDHVKLHQAGRIEPDWVREAKSKRMKGSPCYWCRALSDEDVRYIREHYIPKDKEFGARALGRKFNICHQRILAIVKRESYKDVI